MGGNVWEWCEDRYDEEQKYRVLRGASFADSEPFLLLSSCRSQCNPVLSFNLHGFRVVLGSTAP